MIIVFALFIVLSFVLISGDTLRKHPLPFYLGAALLCAVSLALRALGIYNFTYSGIVAGALFIPVMYAGVFPPGSFGAKKLMPVRAQLSIIGGTFAIEHSLAYLDVTIKRAFSNLGNANAVLSLLISIALLAVMLPLFITSFKFIRKKMDGKKWKKLQRMAYAFYALMYVHVLIFMLPKAIGGVAGYVEKVAIYSFLFITYLFCRIYREAFKNDKKTMVKRQMLSTVGILTVSLMFFISVSLTNHSQAKKNEAMPDVEDAAGEVLLEEKKADGVYYGEGMGNNGKIGVEVTLSDGQIKKIEIVKFPDDEDYFDINTDGAKMIQSMIEAQKSDVDTISGATYSSMGVIDAVEDALSDAQD
ncbi:FMN-binding protein [Butyrivibrio sp. YAB3001]|uniref:FMN-binding protein n=1 Tax=Butyrivibrio sp. YAB3001 TaxID=1520812 RepID=UPI0008F67935|nr:FMN-binding protein [Butyrivibrio sp. YAB3001]SFC53484.1 DMSO/TMAO reductase YedYZ, heme-binding membrane subunit [Butyrivibrio sp. YAB3001]